MRKAYFTIDDAPTDDMYRKIDFLVSKNIPGIWFCIGEFMEKNPEPVIYAIQKGFIIGNHSWSHPHFSDITLEEARMQIQKTDMLIEEIYKKAMAHRPIKMFRFPYGDRGAGDDLTSHIFKNNSTHVQSIQMYLKELGYKNPFTDITYFWYSRAQHPKSVDIYWSFDCLDWALGIKRPFWYPSVYTRDDILKRMNLYFRKHKYSASGEIIITHDHINKKELFEPIINNLLTQDLTFVLPESTHAQVVSR